MTNLVSLVKLKKRDIHWNTEKNVLYRADNRRVICKLQEINEQQVIDHVPVDRYPEAFAANRVRQVRRKRKLTTRDPRPPRKGDGILWHRRMGHPGTMALHKLGENTLGVKLVGPRIVQCQHCSLAKIKRPESRRSPLRDRSIPGMEIHIDWTDIEESHEGFVRVMFITDAASGYVTPYFMTTHGTEKENFAALKDYIEYMESRHGLKVKIVRSDNELFTRRIRRWLSNKKKRDCEPSAPRTQQQNGMAERSGGGVVMAKSRAMRIGANLPHNLWKEIINTAIYLHNRTPRQDSDWKTPYEILYTYTAKLSGLSGIRKPQLSHLRAYGCRAYAMTADAQEKKRRLYKLDPRAHIGYLVGYNSSNIFRIWIPHKGKVISTRDVIFDEDTVFDGKKSHLDSQLICHLDELVTQIEMGPTHVENEKILDSEDDVPDAELPSSRSTCDSDEPNDDDVQMFDEEDNNADELVRAVEDGLITPPPSEVIDKDSAFATHIPFQLHQELYHKDDDEQGGQDGFHQNWDERFESFQRVRIGSAFHGTFDYYRTRKKIHKRIYRLRQRR